MTPRLTIQYLLHAAKRQAVLGGKFATCKTSSCVFPSCFDHDSLRSDCLMIALSSQRAPFGNHIGEVFSVGAIENMARVVASSIVASVAPVVNWIVAVNEFVRYTVNSLLIAALSGNQNLSISPEFANVKGPDKTFVRIMGRDGANKELILSFFDRLSRHRSSPVRAVLGVSTA